jgi:hypothetical protein
MLRRTASTLCSMSALIIACGESAGDVSRAGETPDEEAAEEPSEARPITLTLPKVVGGVLAEDGWGPIVDIGGAEVCLKSERPLGGTFAEFRETHGPCATTVAGEPVRLTVPPQRELLITIHAEGYRRLAAAVVSGARNTADATGTPFLMPSIDSTAQTPGSPELGALTAVVWVVKSDRYGWLAGATFSLDPPAGDGPHYAVAGVIDPSAEATAGSPFYAVDAALPTGHFRGVPEGEYRVQVAHPHAGCQASGFTTSEFFWGFPNTENTLRAPVLAGYGTVVVFECRCDFTGLSSDEIDAIEPVTCQAADGGVP